MRLLASDAAAFSLWCRPLLSFAETKEKVGGGSGRRTEDLCSVCSGEGERELPGDSLRAAEVTSRELRAAPNGCPQPQRMANSPAFLRTVGCVGGLCRELDCSPTPKVQGAD